MKKLILTLKSIGYSNDLIYEIIAGNLSLFGVAFFGHKGTRSEKAKLNYAWKLILKT